MDIHGHPWLISNPIHQVGYVPLEVHIYPYISIDIQHIHTYAHGPSSEKRARAIQDFKAPVRSSPLPSFTQSPRLYQAPLLGSAKLYQLEARLRKRVDSNWNYFWLHFRNCVIAAAAAPPGPGLAARRSRAPSRALISLMRSYMISHMI